MVSPIILSNTKVTAISALNIVAAKAHQTSIFRLSRFCHLIPKKEDSQSARVRKRHQSKSGTPESKGGAIPRGLSRSVDLACQLFLLRRGLQNGSFSFSRRR